MVSFSLFFASTDTRRRDGSVPIRIRARISPGRKQKLFSTGIYITPEQWDITTHKVIEHPNDRLLNLKLQKVLTDLECYILQLELKNVKVTLDQIAIFFKGNAASSFIAFMAEELEKDNRIAKATKYHHQTTLRYLKEFDKSVTFDEFNYDFVDRFDNFLYGKELAQNTVYEHHKRLKKFINLAIRKRLIEHTDNPYLYFKPKQKDTHRIALSKVEIAALTNLDIAHLSNAFNQVRDAFLFQCYTGLRFSDVGSLELHNFRRTENGLELYKLMQKTDKPVFLPLSHLFNGEGEQIIKPYLEKLKNSKQKYIFQLPCNQVTNKNLKRLAEMAHARPITSHIGRHTFVTNATTRYGIEIAQELAGHSKIQTTLKYFHNNKELLIKRLNKA